MRFLSSSLMLSLFLLCGSHSVQAQSFYKWVDAQGSTHYTLTPPPKSVQNMGQVKTYDGPPPPAPTPAPVENQSNAPVSAQETSLLPNLATMNPVELPTTPNNTQTPIQKSPNKTYIPLPPPQVGAQASYY